MTNEHLSPLLVPKIQEEAKMSTLAIPMWYAIGHDSPNSLKFCVITNWWKERNHEGRYTVPCLASSYYRCSDEVYINDDDDSDDNLEDDMASVLSHAEI